MALSFADKIISERGDIIHKVFGEDATGNMAYYFVMVEPIKEAAFMRAIESGGLKLSDYGKVIASCYGEEPTEEVKAELREKYGFVV